MNEEITLNILFPVLNEHLRLERGIRKCAEYMKELVSKPDGPFSGKSYALTIVDNGSDDDTPQIGRAMSDEYPEVEYVRIEERGVGIAFLTGVKKSTAKIVGYMDIDLSTDLKYLEDTINLFEDDPSLEYVNASRFHKDSVTNGRKWYRKITSAGLVFLLKLVFKMKCTDAICGFTFMRREVATKLTEQCSDDKGWFYMIELLLRAERSGVKIYDMPVNWQEDYDTTVKIGKTIRNYLKNIVKLKTAFRREGL